MKQKNENLPKSRSRMSGIDRILQIFDRLQEAEHALSAYDIAKSLEAPVSTIYVIIADLTKKGLLTRNDDNTLWLGPRLYRYGLAYARSLDFLSVADQEMHVLARESGETVQICGRDDDSMVVMAMVEGNGHFRVTSRVGTRVPLNWTASGKLLVGHLPEDERIDIFRRSAKPSPTGRAETDPYVLAQAAHRALQQRLSIQVAESDALIACVASPILDPTGECVATISIVAPEHKVDTDADFYAQAVRKAAREIETKLGWRH
jgi:DNA-binding IclR family transcriptional regulator